MMRGETGRRPRAPPTGPQVFVWLMVALAALSVVTGLMDIVIPRMTGGEPFGVLHALVGIFGPGYLFVHILVHNLGLACLVPGVGLLAGRFEKDARNRVLAARILLATVAVSLLVALQYIVQARERFDLALVVPLLALEAIAVLLLAVRGYHVVRDYVPTPRVGWSLVHPTRELVPWFLASNALLVGGALLEVAAMTGALGA